MKKIVTSLPGRLLAAILLGFLLGASCPESVMAVVVSVKNVLGQVIMFLVPLIILGFIAPSITTLGKNASRLLGISVLIAYTSSVLAALMSTAAGYALIPGLSIDADASVKELPADIFALNIPQIMPVMSALVLSLMLGLAATWTNSTTMIKLLGEFQNIVLSIVQKFIIPILPFYILGTFMGLSYDGTVTHQFPAFVQIIIIVMMGH